MEGPLLQSWAPHECKFHRWKSKETNCLLPFHNSLSSLNSHPHQSFQGPSILTPDSWLHPKSDIIPCGGFILRLETGLFFPPVLPWNLPFLGKLWSGYLLVFQFLICTISQVCYISCYSYRKLGAFVWFILCFLFFSLCFGLGVAAIGWFLELISRKEHT